MCCFSRPVQRVERTSIFARRTGASTQALVYAMTVTSREPVAMILPLPVAPGDDAVRFVSLEGYPDLLRHVGRAFEPLEQEASLARRQAPAPLKVQQVGAFVASYVPTVADFARLDPRFALPGGVWDSLPGYADYGFAVFQLGGFERSGLGRMLGRGATRSVHPMAMEVTTREPDRLFFPTVHVHDGTVHTEADFDHVLYCEGAAVPAGWDAAECPLGDVVDVGRTRGLVHGGLAAARLVLHGQLPNRDTWVSG